MRSHVVSLLAAAFSLGVVQAASAADMPTKAPIVAAPVSSNWTGYYAGLNVGYGIGDDPFSMSTVSGAAYPGLGFGTPLYTSFGNPVSSKIRTEGWTGGGQLGYNYQFDPSWVAGIEADIQGSGVKGTKNCLLPCAPALDPLFGIPGFRVRFGDISAQNKLNWFGTVRGRVGFNGGTNTLLYLTGGLAYGSVERSGSVLGTSTSNGGGVIFNTFAGSYDNSSLRIGWTIGAGWETKLTANWSVKLEYLYIDLGSFTDTFSTFYTTVNCVGCGTLGGQAGVRTDTSKLHENIARVGLNYKFGG